MNWNGDFFWWLFWELIDTENVQQRSLDAFREWFFNTVWREEL